MDQRRRSCLYSAWQNFIATQYLLESRKALFFVFHGISMTCIDAVPSYPCTLTEPSLAAMAKVQAMIIDRPEHLRRASGQVSNRM